ncbi:DUF4199 domain-containing protein [Algoriphagus sp.]|uniref:DUF4199 domain-containing protein n=1 Tax=Algoriphagus sp. TaxID=1872435 RepID=UPI002607CADB|nr:DUF4199 domain-containing protein [Algoriphagus sp.]
MNTSISDVIKKWGLIYGLISVIIVFVSILSGLQEGGSIAVSVITWLISVGLAFTMYFLATKEFREGNNQLLAFGKAYLICLGVGLLGGLLKGLGFYLYVKVIDPAYMERMIEAQLAAQEQFGGGASAQEMPEFMAFFQTAEFFAFSTFFSVILGALIIGLIVAAINQKKEDFSY